MGVCSVIMIFCTVLRNISSKPFQSKFQGQGVSILKTNQGIRAAIDKRGFPCYLNKQNRILRKKPDCMIISKMKSYCSRFISTGQIAFPFFNFWQSNKEQYCLTSYSYFKSWCWGEILSGIWWAVGTCIFMISVPPAHQYARWYYAVILEL